jgi:6 kDa early secretory antigenic target
MSSPEQVWNFPVIYTTLDSLEMQANTIQAGNEQCSAELGHGQAVWEGDASQQWGIEQTRFNNRASDFRTAVSDYINAVRQATQGQRITKKNNHASFT